MSKKRKRKSGNSPARGNTPAASSVKAQVAEVVLLRLTELEDAVGEHCDRKEWTEILALSRLPLTAIHEDDREEAQTFLLQLRMYGLWPSSAPWFSLAKDVQAECREVLQQLADRVEVLHTLPCEFERYLDSLGSSVKERAEVFQRLVRACQDTPTTAWLRRLRSTGLVLLMRCEVDDPELAEQATQALAGLPNVLEVLGQTYSIAESKGTLDDEGRILLRVLRLELDMKMADVWDYGEITQAVRSLPAPSEDAAKALMQQPDDWGDPRLTPNAWAFMWEVGYVSRAAYPDLLQRYPDRFACDACEGVRQLLSALVAAPSKVDGHFLCAMQHLTRFARGAYHRFGESMWVTLGQGQAELFIDSPSLPALEVSTVLLRLYEGAPADFPRHAELAEFYRVMALVLAYETGEDSDKEAVLTPELAWLCEHSLAFQFLAASVLGGTGLRLRLFVEGLHRVVEAGVSMPHDGFFIDEPASVKLSEPLALQIVKALEGLAQVRDRMDTECRERWLTTVSAIFQVLCAVNSKVCAALLPIARAFKEDLLEKDEAFRMAYLEQVAGDPTAALRFYLTYLEQVEKPTEGTTRNLKLLWAPPVDLAPVKQFVDILQEAARTSKHSAIVKQLLADVKRPLAELTQQDQFERTAVNRWPSLSAPARKLLGVLATVQGYSSMKELGSYAGMDVEWVQRHHAKLLELGMLFKEGGTYRLNPHILPLLERESQHAVIGRIVRANGTSAVKQVFNSQREFCIYQILVQLCPNHLVFPNCSLQSVMSFDRMKELVAEDDFGYYLRASVDIVVVSSTTYLPMLAIEVDSVWHDTERQQRKDEQKDRLFATAGIPFLRLRPVGSPSENTIRAQVAEHVDELVRSLREDMPGYDQARGLLEDLASVRT
ncbi:DUF2726 domain-containing protein [Derxia lacustris]|uniref:DUF2726 domain-containing protein n=1 Tax=Derxia lacustris TaxID=764842 RepID=UPI000A1781DF|nr:DUF2726 domain-containing protein [Derxia lacustris]